MSALPFALCASPVCLPFPPDGCGQGFCLPNPPQKEGAEGSALMVSSLPREAREGGRRAVSDVRERSPPPSPQPRQGFPPPSPQRFANGLQIARSSGTQPAHNRHDSGKNRLVAAVVPFAWRLCAENTIGLPAPRALDPPPFAKTAPLSRPLPAPSHPFPPSPSHPSLPLSTEYAAARPATNAP